MRPRAAHGPRCQRWAPRSRRPKVRVNPYCEGSRRRTAIPERPNALVTFALLRLLLRCHSLPGWKRVSGTHFNRRTVAGAHTREVCKNRSGRLSMRKPSSPLIAAAGCIEAYYVFGPTATYELQEKCGKDAAEFLTRWQKSRWSSRSDRGQNHTCHGDL
jgi:hypothetical protein